MCAPDGEVSVTYRCYISAQLGGTAVPVQCQCSASAVPVQCGQCKVDIMFPSWS